MDEHHEPRGSPRLPLSNAAIANRLDEAAAILEDRHDNPFRVRAYRNAAATLRGLAQPVAKVLYTEGAEGLLRLPGIGPRLGRAVESLALTGQLPLLDRLGADGPEDLLATVPGIGPETAHRIHEQLGVETLEDLERAAHDGRLAEVPGMGPKRLRGIREALAGRFRRPQSGKPAALPPVADLLEVDEVYRARAERGDLRQIAPRRFNPTGEAWLPILYLRRCGRRYRALYSNTALAHRLNKTHDWVVIYYRDPDGATGQCTIVTAGQGRLRGKRVVRGREVECLMHYGLLAQRRESTTSR